MGRMSNNDFDPRTGVIAIDPGVNGAYAVLSVKGSFVDCDELPRFAKMVNAVAFSKVLHGLRPNLAIIEKVASRPGQGVSSVFTFGCAYGVAIGCIAGYGAPISFVTPAKWKAHFRLLGKDKDASREIAIRLYPEASSKLGLKKHVGRADALLLARYAFDMDNGGKFI
jgi:Holliday junction resolvasome RuvABC endonuclease subunit